MFICLCPSVSHCPSIFQRRVSRRRWSISLNRWTMLITEDGAPRWTGSSTPSDTCPTNTNTNIQTPEHNTAPASSGGTSAEAELKQDLWSDPYLSLVLVCRCDGREQNECHCSVNSPGSAYEVTKTRTHTPLDMWLVKYTQSHTQTCVLHYLRIMKTTMKLLDLDFSAPSLCWGSGYHSNKSLRVRWGLKRPEACWETIKVMMSSTKVSLLAC